MRWQLLALAMIFTIAPARAEDLRTETVWVSVVISPDDTILCPSVAAHVPDALAEAAIAAVSTRSYADVLASKLWAQELPRNRVEAEQFSRLPKAALERLLYHYGALSGLVAVRLEEIETQTGQFAVSGMQLIGETDPSVTRHEVIFDAVLDDSGAVISATLQGDTPSALEKIARSGLDKIIFDNIHGGNFVRNTQVTVILLLNNTETGDVNVVVGPVSKGPRLLSKNTARYPRHVFSKVNTSWAEVEYDTDASGAVVNPKIVCARPNDVLEKIHCGQSKDLHTLRNA